jgi:phosphoglycolate phosphatase
MSLGVPAVMLFDLDGTLSDSEPGIAASLRHAFQVHGLPPLTEQQVRGILGPPFTKSLPQFVAADRVEEVIATYREYYREGGMYDATVYPGIFELLSFLRSRDVTLAVATSKVEPFAVPIVERLGLREYFVTIGGDEFDGSRDSKALVVGEVLRRLGCPDPRTVVLVGDRVHDVEGAGEHGVACIVAGWGYGTRAELAGAAAWYPSAGELLLALREGP